MFCYQDMYTDTGKGIQLVERPRRRRPTSAEQGELPRTHWICPTGHRSSRAQMLNSTEVIRSVIQYLVSNQCYASRYLSVVAEPIILLRSFASFHRVITDSHSIIIIYIQILHRCSTSLDRSSAVESSPNHVLAPSLRPSALKVPTSALKRRSCAPTATLTIMKASVCVATLYSPKNTTRSSGGESSPLSHVGLVPPIHLPSVISLSQTSISR